MFKGSDETLEMRSRELLEHLKIPMAEIESLRVVQERTQVGERDEDG